METDPFASIRVESADVASSYEVALLPSVTPEIGFGVTENPQKTAMLPALPALPATISEGERWKTLAGSYAADWRMLNAWAEGLAALELMAVPDGATPARWQQIVADAVDFTTRNHRDAIEAGWSIENVFGFDPDDDETPIGLVVEIRGGKVTILSDGAIAVRHADDLHYYYPGKAAAGTPMIWAINRNRRERQRGVGQ